MIIQNSQYVIKSLTIFSGGASPGSFANVNSNDVKEFGIDVRGLFQEINIFENIFFPCITGNILIHDAVGLNRKIRFDGSEYIFIHIQKDKGTSEGENPFEIKATFLIHKLTGKTNIGMNSEAYTLHFISQEYLLSEQQKIRKSFSGLYSDTVEKILTDYLRLKEPTNQINILDKTKNGNKIIIPNLTPFGAIQFITNRSLNKFGVPDFVFWQNQREGYNFASLSSLFSKNSDFEVNFGAKNISLNYIKDSKDFNLYYHTVMLGANDFQIINGFDLIDNVKNGYYAGKFFGFDPLTRKFTIKEVSHDKIYGKIPPGKKMPFDESIGDPGSHANPYPFNTKIYNKQGRLADEMFESKITVYPYEIDRKNSSYVKENDGASLNDIDETDSYVLQRKSILHNLYQRVVKIIMPGNFRFLCGKTVILNVPSFNNQRQVDNEEGDMSMSGKYIISAVRHIIRYDRHETVLEVMTDSSQIDPLTGKQ